MQIIFLYIKSRLLLFNLNSLMSHRRPIQGGSGFSGQIVGLNPRDLDLYRNRVNIIQPNKSRAEMTRQQFLSRRRGKLHSFTVAKGASEVQLNNHGLSKKSEMKQTDHVVGKRAHKNV